MYLLPICHAPVGNFSVEFIPLVLSQKSWDTKVYHICKKLAPKNFRTQHTVLCNTKNSTSVTHHEKD